jgi:two-component system sensor histidine kinase YesM
MRRQKSIFFMLLIPICISTLVLLSICGGTMAAVYLKQVKETAINSNLEILNQTSTSLSLLNEHIAKVAYRIRQKPYLENVLKEPILSSTDEYANRQQLGHLFADNPTAIVDYDIVIFGTNGIAVSSGNGGVTMSSEELMALPVFKGSAASSAITYDSQSTGISYSTRARSVIIGCQALQNAEKKVYGGVMIVIKESSLRQFYQSFLNKSTNIVLLTNSGTVLSSNVTDEIGEKNLRLLKLARENHEAGSNYSQTSQNEIILSRYLPSYNAYIVSHITTSVLVQSYPPPVSMILVIVISLILLIVVVVCIIQWNLRSLKQLANHMASSDTVPSPIALHSSSEMNMISNAYNNMVEKLNIYLQRLAAAHEKERRDELDLLQMQINPHFLYNTLDSIKHMVSVHNQTDACQTIDSLISLLRSTLGKTNMMVSLKDEIVNAENYISIIEPRYGGVVHAEITADDSCLEYQIPNLLLQPLIENAFFHAFQVSKKGSIRVFFYLADDMLSCDVIDNGDGIGAEQLQALFTQNTEHLSITKIGIYNIKKRLDILFPERNEFTITSEPGYGTCIHFTFPAIKYTADSSGQGTVIE